MSNLPPGVSGSEPQIAGYAERTEYVTCGDDGATIHSVPADHVEDIDRIISVLEPGDMTFQQAASRATNLLRMLKGSVEQIEVETCPFEGDIEVSLADGFAWWTCPLCHTERETEMPTGPDPDDVRDMMRDMEEDD